MAKIFINYRRAESLKDARHLATLLDKGPFRGRIFIDLKGLDGAPDWLHELERQVAASDAMISVICPGWADVCDADGKRRIDNDKDFVRFELAEAFRRNIPVIPVLVDGARMPRGSELPDNLLYLTRPQAELLRAESFDADCAKIAKRVQAEIAARRMRGVPGWAVVAAAVVTLAGGIAAGPTVMERLGLATAGSDEAARARIAQLRAELADADAAARSAQTARLKAEGDATGLRTEIGRLTSVADTARKQAEEARSQADARAKEIASLRSEMAVLSKRAEVGDAAGADSQRLSSLLGTAQKARDEAVTRADALAKQIFDLEARVAQLNAETGAAKKADQAARRTPQPGQTFRDCSDCPEMVVIPASTTGNTSIPQPIAVGKFEVTFAEWDACVAAGGCQHKPEDSGWGRGNPASHPCVMGRRDEAIYPLASQENRQDLSAAERRRMGVCSPSRHDNGLLLGRRHRQG